MAVFRKWCVDDDGSEYCRLVGHGETIDPRRPASEEYLTRPDMPVIGIDFVERCRRLESDGVCKAQIAEAMNCNLRDVFRALVGDEYLDRFTVETEKPNYLRGRTEWKTKEIRESLSAGDRSLKKIVEECAVTMEHVKAIVREAGGQVYGDTIVIGESEFQAYQEKIRAQKIVYLQNWLRQKQAGEPPRVKRRINRPRMSAETEQEIIRVIKETGKPYREIAREFGVHPGSVSYLGKKCGQPKRPRGFPMGMRLRRSGENQLNKMV